MSQPPTQALLIFIKNLEKGSVKTRLAATIGDEEALQVYHKLLDYTRRVTLQTDAALQLWYSCFIAEDDAWSDREFDKYVQEGESLGERMRNAFEQAFNEGLDKAVIIGSDCAQMQAGHIEQAYHALDANDVVIGPSEDGGYYLLGMNRFLPELFEGKEWSTSQVFEQTLDDCKKYDLSCHILEELNDVDTEADWQQVRDRF